MSVRLRLIAFICLGLSMAGSNCDAGFTFLGPTPYLSAADSPFPVGGSNPNFFLEDFEPDEPCVPGNGVICGGGKFDAPGAQMIYGTPIQGPSIEPNGHSALATDLGIIIGSSSIVAVGFEIDRNELGFWPTEAGVVLTDGAGPFSGLSVYDALGNRADFLTEDLEIDPLNPATYRFIGASNPQGISMAVFFKRIFDDNPSAFPRIDHFQYGNVVPEPSETYFFSSALTMFGFVIHRRKYGLRQT